MPSYLRRRIPQFLALRDSEVIATLAIENAAQRFPLLPDAIHAWNWQLPVLKQGLSTLLHVYAQSTDWDILLEYPIPQIGKRIDAVLLAHNVIIAIETKSGASPTSARRQVEDYAIALACFHEGSCQFRIVPIVVSDSHVAQPSERTQFETLIQPCRISRSAELGDNLADVCGNLIDFAKPAIDSAHWDNARFRPIPPIIDAAVKLYAGMDVFEIGHAAAAREDLEKTTSALVDICEKAKRKQAKAICFVTGVPGAGKTLVGLNAVHHSTLKDVAMFLSGNGPLVKIIREALIRDVIRREKKTRRSAELTLHAFVSNVHRFADEHGGNENQEPSRNVIVFDEAQRAWDVEQNKRPSRSGKGRVRPPVSEPHMLLEIMNRRKDWAVLIALIGGGQEINRGEAGLSEWGRSLAAFPHWQVYASEDVIEGRLRTNGFELFPNPDPHPPRVHALGDLHLRVNTRSIRAQAISQWVDAVLNGDSESASLITAELAECPMITRDLALARRWLEQRRIGLTRSGFVTCAAAVRLRADGLEPTYDFHRFFEWEHWFLDRNECEEVDCQHEYCSDIRASSKLEVCATQFEIQGLELDWVGVCWGEDLVWDGKTWVSQKFNNKYWTPVQLDSLTPEKREKAEKKHQYRVNAYRVLLTRARQGMIIYVPKPSRADSSRSHDLLDASYAFLCRCGAVVVC